MSLFLVLVHNCYLKVPKTENILYFLALFQYRFNVDNHFIFYNLDLLVVSKRCVQECSWSCVVDNNVFWILSDWSEIYLKKKMFFIILLCCLEYKKNIFISITIFNIVTPNRSCYNNFLSYISFLENTFNNFMKSIFGWKMLKLISCCIFM